MMAVSQKLQSEIKLSPFGVWPFCRVLLVLLATMDWMESLACPAHLVLLVPLALAE